MTAGDAQLCHTSAEDPMVLGRGGAAAQAGAHLHMFKNSFLRFEIRSGTFKCLAANSKATGKAAKPVGN